jgi:hypothetical protein
MDLKVVRQPKGRARTRLEPETGFDSGLSRTVDGCREHLECWQPLKQRLTRESRGFGDTAGKGSGGVKVEVENNHKGDG